MKQRLLIYASLLGVLFSASCKKDFDTINKNPNGFTTASDGSLFNATISSLKSGWNEQLYVNLSVLYKETQQTEVPFVRWNNYTLGTEEIWSDYYNTLPNFRELEKRFSTLDTSLHEIKNMIALEKIVLAYKTFKVTDLFGDIPFFDAGYGFQDVNKLHPAFDSQQKIYFYLLNELDWAQSNIDVAAIDKDPYLTFIKFDNLFFGNLSKWRKFANSLRLRYAMRMVNKEPVLAGQIVKDILENGKPLFGLNSFGQGNTDYTECAVLYPYQLGYRNESKGWSFNQSRELRMGTNIWHWLSKNNNDDGSGIFDPRAYYFFETNGNTPGKWIPFPNDPASATPDGGAPYDYQRDHFYTVKGTAASPCLYSPVNYYLARDMDYIPDILITGAEVIFLRSEAYLLGIGVAKDVAVSATNSFLDGIQFSLSFWQTVMNNSRLPSDAGLGDNFSTNINVPSINWFNSIQFNTDFFTTDEQGQLKDIYAQCWLDLFRQPQEAFALARRTGLTPHEGAASEVYRFPIPQTEVANNQANWSAAYGGGDYMNTKVWWMK